MERPLSSRLPGGPDRRYVAVLTRRPLFLVLLLVLVLVFPAGALTYPSPESKALDNLGTFTNYFESTKKRLPESWAELEKAWAKPLDEAFPQVLPTRRYQWYSPPLDVRLDEKRSLQLVAITRTPMLELTYTDDKGEATAFKGPGRYLLYREEDGTFRHQWFDESEVQRLWPSTGQAMPVPDDEPERPWVRLAQRSIIMNRVGIGIAIAMVLGGIAVHYRAKRRARAPQPPRSLRRFGSTRRR